MNNQRPIEIPGAHILPCPHCGVPVDASEADVFIIKEKKPASNPLVHWANLGSVTFNLVCPSCCQETDMATVAAILEEKDGWKRTIAVKIDDEGGHGVALAFERIPEE
jgi:hypothetical protein